MFRARHEGSTKCRAVSRSNFFLARCAHHCEQREGRGPDGCGRVRSTYVYVHVAWTCGTCVWRACESTRALRPKGRDGARVAARRRRGGRVSLRHILRNPRRPMRLPVWPALVSIVQRPHHCFGDGWANPTWAPPECVSLSSYSAPAHHAGMSTSQIMRLPAALQPPAVM